MEIKTTLKNIKLTPNLQTKIERRIGKLNRHKPDIQLARMAIIKEETRSIFDNYLVEVIVEIKGNVFRSESRSNTILKALDSVVEALDRQLKEYKNKMNNKNRRPSPIRNGNISGVLSLPIKRRIIGPKKRIAGSMTLETAVDNLEASSDSLYIFVNIETDKLNLLSQRKDGALDLIEIDT
jgi:putative sigma-54 modulation protein